MSVSIELCDIINFWLLIDVCFLLLHVSFILDCLMYFFHYSVLRVRFDNKIYISVQQSYNKIAFAVGIFRATLSFVVVGNVRAYLTI